MKIRNIIEGWYRRWFKPLNEREKRRLTICEACDEKTKIGRHDYYCNHCGCIIAAKVRSSRETCALNKW